MTLPTDEVAWPSRAPALFTTRDGGVSVGGYASLNLGGRAGDDPAAVTENRRRLAEAVGLPPERLLFMRQVQGADVATVRGPWERAAEPAAKAATAEPAEPPQVDALVTATRGLALAVLVADCVPVLLADSDGTVCAAAHAGRPGLVAGVVPATVRRMRELGAGQIHAALGPAVCGGCYELPAELADAVAAVVPAARSATRWGTPSADIRAGIVSQLEACGVTSSTMSTTCTIESQRHFSYRRDRDTGRFAGCVWLPA